MKTISFFLLVFFFALPAQAAKEAKVAKVADPTEAAGTVLDAWHAAAAKAKEEEYFSLFTDDAVFLGTDPKERWTKEEFRKFAHPHFAKGKAWSIQSRSRHISLSTDKKTAWFDEEAESSELGPVRGSGVLSLVKGKWKVAQYNLSVPIWNEKFDDIRKLNVPKIAD